MEICDLKDPSVDSNSAFIIEVNTAEDSDVELELPEEDIPDQSKVLPIHRQRLEDDDDDVELEPTSNGETLEWRVGVTAPPAVNFSGPVGLQVPVPDDATPLDYFRLMIDDGMMETIVAETNRYAADTMRGKNLSPSSRFHLWTDVTAEEMWGFFGLTIAMGLIVIEDLDDYWSMDEMYNLPLFRSVMTRDRFCLIMSFLHLCDNSAQLPITDPNHDPLFKIRQFITPLNDNFKRTFVPGAKLAIDEAMIAWRGRLSFRAHSPDNWKPVGIKVFELCDSLTGYCSNLEFYTGKKEASAMGPTFDVVNRLIEPYLGCGRTLFVDNHYTSPDLFTFLQKNDTLACGTLRLSRRNCPPKSMVPKLMQSKETPQILTNGTLNLLRFYDKKEVNMLTTAYDASLVNTGRVDPITQEPVIKMKAVNDYNKFMGAVDRSDQMVTFNAFKRRTLKWWKKAFFHMLMLGVLNSYIVHTSNAAKKLSHRIFRRDLAKDLIRLMPITIAVPKVINIGDTSLMRLTARHFPGLIQPRSGAKIKRPQRDCVVCSQPKRRLASRYECSGCNVGLHIVPCFRIYHTQQDFKITRPLKRKLDE